MTLLWTMIAIWLCFATLLPIYVLFKAMFPRGSPTPNAYPHGSCAASKRGMGGVMIAVAAIIPVALVAGSLIGVFLNARLASRRRQAELRAPQLDEFVQSAFQALRELRVRSELTAKLNDDVDRAYGANTLDYSRD